MPSWCCIQYVSKSGRPRNGHRTGKGQSSSQFPRRVVLKNALTIRQLHSSLVAQAVKRLSSMQETWVRSLGREDPLEKEMAIHSITIAWKIPWTEEPGRLQSMGSQRVGHDWATSLTPMLVRSCLKSCMLDFSIIGTKNFQMSKLDLVKEVEPEIKLPTFTGSLRKLGNSKKTSSSVSSTTPKPLTVWIITNCGKFLKRWEYFTEHLTCLLRNL